MIYTHHPELHAAYPGSFAPAEVLVDKDFGGHSLPTPVQIDKAFAGEYGDRLPDKVARARDNNALIVADLEPPPYTLADVARHRTSALHLADRLDELLPGNRTAIYGLPVRRDFAYMGQAELAKPEPHPWWLRPENYKQVQAELHEAKQVAAQTARSYGDNPAEGVVDRYDYLATNLYQSRRFAANGFRAKVWLPPLLASTNPLRVMGMFWPFAEDRDGKIDIADLDEYRETASIYKAAGGRHAFAWWHKFGLIDTPGARERVEILLEMFA